MAKSLEPVAESFLKDLWERHNCKEAVPPEEVQRLTDLLGKAVAEERNACAEIAEEYMRLCGSHAAEQAANRIRARGQAD